MNVARYRSRSVQDHENRCYHRPFPVDIVSRLRPVLPHLPLHARELHRARGLAELQGRRGRQPFHAHLGVATVPRGQGGPDRLYLRLNVLSPWSYLSSPGLVPPASGTQQVLFLTST